MHHTEISKSSSPFEFLLSDDVLYLNHGSRGACLKPIFEKYQAWQLELEKQPCKYFNQTLPSALERARVTLSKFVGSDKDELVYVPNPTFAVNAVASSIQLQQGDEVLSSDHEYGACVNIWRAACARQNAVYREVEIPLPVGSQDDLYERFISEISPNTKLIFLSHITSPTALRLPIERICKYAKENGILTLIDGAHAIGQIDLDLQSLGADFYTAACHKWMCMPKGSSFFYARNNVQELLQPLVVGWGFKKTDPNCSRLIDLYQYLGTKDFASYLCIDKAVEIYCSDNWKAESRRCKELAIEGLERLAEIDALSSIYLDFAEQNLQMFALELRSRSANDLQKKLLVNNQTEIRGDSLGEKEVIRISLQVYNCIDDIESLYKLLSTNL